MRKTERAGRMANVWPLGRAPIPSARSRGRSGGTLIGPREESGSLPAAEEQPGGGMDAGVGSGGHTGRRAMATTDGRAAAGTAARRALGPGQEQRLVLDRVEVRRGEPLDEDAGRHRVRRRAAGSAASGAAGRGDGASSGQSRSGSPRAARAVAAAAWRAARSSFRDRSRTSPAGALEGCASTARRKSSVSRDRRRGSSNSRRSTGRPSAWTR